ncbi:MAG: SGNH/GDSL hydrolase family protein [Clostridia bacterium]|nr:SGNH/GDSL hydrolase family protein [Clostridia bacterium]
MNLKGKTVLFLGSSVTYGSAANGISFADIMAEECGINCVKEAVSGTTLADINDLSYVSRLKKVDTETKVNLFICQLSTNDTKEKYNIELSEIEEAIRFILNYVKETFSCPLVFYTGTYFDNEKYKEMIELLYSLQKEYDFYILDLFNDTEMRSVSKEDYDRYMYDPRHPTYDGYKEWWTPKFIKFCENLKIS